MNKIMQQIKTDCEIRKISQRELAEKSKITEVSISRYFTGSRTPSIDNVEKMAAALGLKVALIKKWE